MRKPKRKLKRKLKRKSALYQAYYNILSATSNKNCKRYENIGRLGITMEFASLSEFESVLGRRPSSKHWVDRFDLKKNYSLSNVFWSCKEKRRQLAYASGRKKYARQY